MTENEDEAIRMKKLKSSKLSIFVLVTSILLSSCTWAEATSTIKPSRIEYVGMVLDEDQKKIEGAKIRLTFRGIPIVVYFDKEGVYKFLVDVEQDKLPGRVQIEADGYNTYDRNITLSKNNLSVEEIRLIKLQDKTLTTPNIEQIEYSGYVFDETDGTEIYRAKVTLKLENKKDIDFTDSTGLWRFLITKKGDKLLA